jgi:hypothetical protein
MLRPSRLRHVPPINPNQPALDHHTTAMSQLEDHLDHHDPRWITQAHSRSLVIPYVDHHIHYHNPTNYHKYIEYIH